VRDIVVRNRRIVGAAKARTVKRHRWGAAAHSTPPQLNLRLIDCDERIIIFRWARARTG
jgi:hypothetical protein